jgi:hypothetical protein
VCIINNINIRLCTKSFNALERADDDPHRVETHSLVDYFQHNIQVVFDGSKNHINIIQVLTF